MDAKVQRYLPYIFRSFQGFRTKDVKEFHSEQRMELILESKKDRVRLWNCCALSWLYNETN